MIKDGLVHTKEIKKAKIFITQGCIQKSGYESYASWVR